MEISKAGTGGILDQAATGMTDEKLVASTDAVNLQEDEAKEDEPLKVKDDVVVLSGTTSKKDGSDGDGIGTGTPPVP